MKMFNYSMLLLTINRMIQWIGLRIGKTLTHHPDKSDRQGVPNYCMDCRHISDC